MTEPSSDAREPDLHPAWQPSHLARWERAAIVLIVVCGLIAYGQFIADVIR